MSERDAIVAWLREDAGKTRQDLSRMHARHQLNMAQTAEWESIITLKSGIADAIERGDHLPASVADDSRLDWNIPDNLRWLAEQPNRPPRVPCGYLTGQFLKLCADRWSTHAGEVERLREALKLAANRLARAALDHDVSSSKFLEVSEWGEEARQALEASR